MITEEIMGGVVLVSGTLVGNSFLSLADSASVFTFALFVSAIVSFVLNTSNKPGGGSFVIAGIDTFDEVFGGSVFKIGRIYTRLELCWLFCCKGCR